LQSGLVAGNYYSFKVRAVNYIGESTFSKRLRIIAASVPLPPAPVFRVGSTVSSVTLGWVNNSDDGGAIIRDTLVYWDQGNAAALPEEFVQADHTSY
jgi:hypothetical protein